MADKQPNKKGKKGAASEAVNKDAEQAAPAPALDLRTRIVLLRHELTTLQDTMTRSIASISAHISELEAQLPAQEGASAAPASASKPVKKTPEKTPPSPAAKPAPAAPAAAAAAAAASVPAKKGRKRAAEEEESGDDPERLRTCVRCGTRYTEQSNTDVACAYHPLVSVAVVFVRSQEQYKCCKQKAKSPPCQHGRHTDKKD